MKVKLLLLEDYHEQRRIESQKYKLQLSDHWASHMCEIAPFMIFDKKTSQQGNVGSNSYNYIQ